MQPPSFLRRLGALLYEALTVLALWLMASALFTSVLGEAVTPFDRLLLQTLSFGIISAYFLWCWSHGGQTLAMKTWRIRLVRADGPAAPPVVALLVRLMLVLPGLLLAGVGIWWALLDPERQFLHDRLARTRLIMAG